MAGKEKTNSIIKTAKVTGILYLLLIVLVIMGGMGRGVLVVAGDAAETAQNIMANEWLFRLSIVFEALVFLIEIVLAALLYVLFAPVNQGLSLAAAFGRLAEAVVQGINLLNSLIALLLISGASYLTVFEPEQLQALGLLFHDAHSYVILIWGTFFGLHLLVLGYLVYKSGYIPGILGILLVMASVGYLLESFGAFVLPQYREIFATIVAVLGFPGELAFTFWLLIKGINIAQWEKRVLKTG